MINVSRQTQTWSKSVQEPATKSDNRQNISSVDKQKFFGTDDVGAVLNKAADPNWTDPEKKLRAVGNASLDKDAFLKLLLTQMKNQDPTNPMKSHEMSAQLAQFTSLEKLTNIDESINGLRKDQSPSQNFEASNLIGKAVSGDSSKILRTDPKQAHMLRFQLRGDAAKVKVDVKDEEGKIVKTLEFNNLKNGKNEVPWNGQLEDGTQARPGEYRLDVDARNAFGKKIWVDTKFDGVIDGIHFTPQGPLLMVGKQQIRLSDVEKVVSVPQGPTSTEQLQAQPAPMLPLPPSAASGVNKESIGNPKSHVNDVALSSGIMNQLKKQGAM